MRNAMNAMQGQSKAWPYINFKKSNWDQVIYFHHAALLESHNDKRCPGMGSVKRTGATPPWSFVGWLKFFLEKKHCEKTLKQFETHGVEALNIVEDEPLEENKEFRRLAASFAPGAIPTVFRIDLGTSNTSAWNPVQLRNNRGIFYTFHLKGHLS